MESEQIKDKARLLAIELSEKDYISIHDAKTVLLEFADWILNNMWVSVEEDLPPYNKAVIAMDYDPVLDWEDQRIIFGHRSNNPDVITDKNKFCVYPPTICKISHWVEIPPFKKGEES